MWFTSLLSSAKAACRPRWPAGGRRRAGGGQQHTRRCCLERLEERAVLSTGIVITDTGNGYDQAWASFLDASGNLVVAGAAGNATLLRYQSDGTLDPTFGTGGILNAPIGRGESWGRALADYGDGRIVMAGMAYQRRAGSGGYHQQDFFVARYNANGTRDTTFGGSGVVFTDLNGTKFNDDYATAVLVQSDGKIVAAGRATAATGENVLGLVRYNSDGSLDTSFDRDGIVMTGLGGGDAYFRYRMAMQGDKILVVGRFWNGDVWNGVPGYDLAVLRYNADGSLDDGSSSDTNPEDSFGDGGMVITEIPSPWPNPGDPASTWTDTEAHALCFDGAGKIVVAGYTGVRAAGAGVGNFGTLLRYTPDGILDHDFGDWVDANNHGLVAVQK